MQPTGVVPRSAVPGACLMEPEATYDIFRKTSDTDATWVESIDGLEQAKKRMMKLASTTPAPTCSTTRASPNSSNPSPNPPSSRFAVRFGFRCHPDRGALFAPTRNLSSISATTKFGRTERKSFSAKARRIDWEYHARRKPSRTLQRKKIICWPGSRPEPCSPPESRTSPPAAHSVPPS